MVVETLGLAEVKHLVKIRNVSANGLLTLPSDEQPVLTTRLVFLES